MRTEWLLRSAQIKLNYGEMIELGAAINASMIYLYETNTVDYFHEIQYYILLQVQVKLSKLIPKTWIKDNATGTLKLTHTEMRVLNQTLLGDSLTIMNFKLTIGSKI